MARILVVEDEAVLRDTIADNLRQVGHDVRAVEDGETTLVEVRDNLPDKLVLDIMLPSIDGFDVCHPIRGASSIPILILTARDDEIDRVFERFYKTEKSRSDTGSGLGLAIARHLVQLHGGRIWAESGPRGGTSFRFTIPVATDDVDPDEPSSTGT